MQRRELLNESDALNLWAVIDETVLHTSLFDRDVMDDQIIELINAAKRPNVRIQLNTTPTVTPTTFAILRFAAPELPDIVYVEQLTSALYIDADQEVDHYANEMERLAVYAESPDRSIEMLEMSLTGLRGEARQRVSKVQGSKGLGK